MLGQMFNALVNQAATNTHSPCGGGAGQGAGRGNAQVSIELFIIVLLVQYSSMFW